MAFTKFIVLLSLPLAFAADFHSIHNLTSNTPFEGDSRDEDHLSILCYAGLSVVIENTWSLTYLYFYKEPVHYKVFFNDDAEQMIDNYQSLWPASKSLLSTKSIYLPSFKHQCVGILTKDSFQVALIQTKVSISRLLTLVAGLILFRSANTISRNTLFYYSSCTTIGILTSLLIVVFIISKVIPRKIAALIALFGSSALILTAQFIWDNLNSLIFKYKSLLFVYVLVSAVVSFSFAYIYGPVTNSRILDLIRWALQLCGLILIFSSTEIYEFSIIIIALILLFYNLDFKNILSFRLSKNPKLKRLTPNEYRVQGEIETQKALEELKKFCRSPDCNAWKMICKLQDPIRFAKFIEDQIHITDEEIFVYESSFISDGNSILIRDDDDTSNSLSSCSNLDNENSIDQLVDS